MDTQPSKKLRAESYPCDSCPVSGDKACSNCLFASWNVNGVLAGFHPKKQYRQEHRDELTVSPMIQGLPSAPVISIEEMTRKLHPKMPKVVVGSFNRISEVMQKLGYNRVGEN